MRQIDPKDYDYDGAGQRRLPEGRKETVRAEARGRSTATATGDCHSAGTCAAVVRVQR